MVVLSRAAFRSLGVTPMAGSLQRIEVGLARTLAQGALTHTRLPFLVLSCSARVSPPSSMRHAARARMPIANSSRLSEEIVLPLFALMRSA